MAVKVRKQIYIEPHQEVLLKQLAAGTGVSEAEIIRQALDRHMQSLQTHLGDTIAWTEERAFVERLIELGPIPGQRTWKREDLYER